MLKLVNRTITDLHRVCKPGQLDDKSGKAITNNRLRLAPRAVECAAIANSAIETSARRR